MISVVIIMTISNAISLLSYIAGGRGGGASPVPDPQIQEAPSGHQEEAVTEEGSRVFLKSFQ
jgi:hypothetical protein